MYQGRCIVHQVGNIACFGVDVVSIPALLELVEGGSICGVLELGEKSIRHVCRFPLPVGVAVAVRAPVTVLPGDGEDVFDLVYPVAGTGDVGGGACSVACRRIGVGGGAVEFSCVVRYRPAGRAAVGINGGRPVPTVGNGSVVSGNCATVLVRRGQICINLQGRRIISEA